MELNFGWIQNGVMAIQGAVEAHRANEATERANDLASANYIHSNAAREHAAAATNAEVNLIGALAEVQRLKELVEELSADNRHLLEAAADLLTENDRLRTRH